MTYAQERSHDQYYFNNVAQIVSGSVRLPIIPLDNMVIARRHVNALALQRFFHQQGQDLQSNNLLGAFGSVGDAKDVNHGSLVRLRTALGNPMFIDPTVQIAERVLDQYVSATELRLWLAKLPDEMESAISKSRDDEDLLEVIINAGLLPRYAFPVDVVTLYRNKPDKYEIEDDVSRDLQIALSEFAPGAELVIDGNEYQVVGLYDRYKGGPYEPTAQFYQCPECRAVYTRSLDPQGNPTAPWADRCESCKEPHDSRRVSYTTRPPGFRTDWRIRDVKKYRGGKQERAGSASTAQLEMGASVDNGDLLFNDRLWLSLRSDGDLYSVNRGPDPQDVGFWICPKCGRGLKQQNEKHAAPDTYGKHQCDGKPKNRVVLLHSIRTGVVLLGLNLPPGYVGDPRTSAGRAVWLSMGSALLRAAAAELQIDPSELAMGMRPWRISGDVLSGEVYLYDTLPNGAGYAQAMADPVTLKAIFERAMELCSTCKCNGACYSCMLDYSNQRIHALLDRRLALDVLRFVLDGILPAVTTSDMERALQHLKDFAIPGSNFQPVGAGIVQLQLGNRSITVEPRHPLQERRSGGKSAYPTVFDLERRPFWVWTHLMQNTIDEL